MITLFIIIASLALLSCLLFVWGNIEFKLYLKKLSDENSLDTINKKIDNYKYLLSTNRFSGKMLGNILYDKELWEQVRNYKLAI